MSHYENSSNARIAPAAELDEDVQGAIDAVMRGLPPLVLFTTLARDRRLFFKFFAGGFLDRGHLSIRQREIVINRTTALNEAEYEWGVHVSGFAAAACLTDAQVTSIVFGDATDACWDADDAVLIRMSDALHRKATLDDQTWSELSDRFSEEAILELILVAGFYRTTSYLVNSLRLPLEKGMAQFQDFAPPA